MTLNLLLLIIEVLTVSLQITALDSLMLVRLVDIKYSLLYLLVILSIIFPLTLKLSIPILNITHCLVNFPLLISISFILMS